MAGASAAKKRKGFRVGPENLPDGAWKRKGNTICRVLLEDKMY